jgi:hypothetical protein
MPKTRKKKTATPQAAGDRTVANPDRERVEMRAYELYLARGGGDGQAMDDWLIAERELVMPASGDNGNHSNRGEES